jgi:hypothetical protein
VPAVATLSRSYDLDSVHGWTRPASAKKALVLRARRTGGEPPGRMPPPSMGTGCGLSLRRCMSSAPMTRIATLRRIHPARTRRTIMSDIDNAMRHLRDVITGRTDGLCGRLNQDKLECRNDLGIRIVCSAHVSADEQRLNDFLHDVAVLARQVQKIRR